MDMIDISENYNFLEGFNEKVLIVVKSDHLNLLTIFEWLEYNNISWDLFDCGYNYGSRWLYKKEIWLKRLMINKHILNKYNYAAEDVYWGVSESTDEKSICFLFENKDDAILFKLTCG